MYREIPTNPQTSGLSIGFSRRNQLWQFCNFFCGLFTESRAEKRTAVMQHIHGLANILPRSPERYCVVYLRLAFFFDDI
jgi:hypothetical protein